jgi:hypothetical protein
MKVSLLGRPLPADQNQIQSVFFASTSWLSMEKEKVQFGNEPGITKLKLRLV